MANPAKRLVQPEGFTVLKDSPNARFDIVLVHGLGGDPYKTWACSRPTSDHFQPDRPLPQDRQRTKRNFKQTFRRLWLHRRKRAVGLEDGGTSRDSMASIASLEQTPNAPQTASYSEVYWPLDLLASEEWCKDARVLVYGYDSKVTKGYAHANKTDLFGHAKNLLFDLQREKPPKRPVIFIAHSLGGLLVKELLRRSHSSEEDDLKDIVQSTIGIIFFGTPHRGSDMAGLGETARKVASLIIRVDSSSSVLRALTGESPELELSRESFVMLWRTYNFRVKTFQEAYGLSYVNIGPATDKVVLDISSTLDDPKEHAQTISENHMNMCRFPSRQNAGYQKASSEVRTIMRLHSQASKSKMNLTNSQIDNHTKKILEVLFFPEMYDRQRNIQKALDETCNWLFMTPQYKTWDARTDLERNRGLLWIKGKPGAGKSTLMKEAVRRSGLDKEVTTVAFFFNARGAKQLEKTALGLYRSLLHQVLQEDRQSLELLIPSYNAKTKFGPNVHWVEEELQDMIT